MPSDVYAALCLSALDRLSAHVPDIISTAELEALRAALNESGEYANAIGEFNIAIEQHSIDSEEAEKKIQQMIEMIQQLQSGFKQSEMAMHESFRYDGAIGTALILLRDATLHQPEEGWRKAAMSVLNELFDKSPQLTPWHENEPTFDDEERPYPKQTPEKQQLLDRFEEAVAVHRIPGAVARRIEMELRIAEEPILYSWIISRMRKYGLDNEHQKLICDIVFMQDGDPDEKTSGVAEPPSHVPRILSGLSSETSSEGE